MTLDATRLALSSVSGIVFVPSIVAAVILFASLETSVRTVAMGFDVTGAVVVGVPIPVVAVLVLDWDTVPPLPGRAITSASFASLGGYFNVHLASRHVWHLETLYGRWQTGHRVVMLVTDCLTTG